MGRYLQGWKRPPRTIEEALHEAERDHFLDCPEPSLQLRISAAVIDLFFLWLLFGAIQQLQSLSTLITIFVAQKTTLFHGLPILSIVVSASQWLFFIALFLYTVIPLHLFGGTPGKLLMGLRVIDSKTGKNLSISYAMLREWVGKPIGLLSFGLLLLPYLHKGYPRPQKTITDQLGRSVVKKVQGVW